ncbi:phenylacetate--CoA ligase family protein [Brevibacillus formosus]|uniref:phenylacetate--CoA ligase family protein n=1 Tax=Brevibacillus formosus TaxID=54913 RepID=UPI0018CE6E49|nr:phenylacetate--CoA ligase family protein [Brevibacillus formosus]MBG9941031.1 hypothetical protein [Brevibacillus formosus]
MLASEFERHKDRLAKILYGSYENNTFYRGLLTNFPSFYLESYENWCELPIVKKNMIQDNWENFVSHTEVENNPRIISYTTSGTTGAPMTVYRHRSEELFLTKLLWKERQKWATDIMKWKLLYLYRRLESKRQDVLTIANDYYLDLSEKSILSYCKSIEEYEPHWIIGPATAVTRLAQVFKQMNKSFPSLKLIELYGEMLLPHQRRIIEDTFQCPVINHYGTREFYVMSYECPQKRMHAKNDHLFFEVINNESKLQGKYQGELVVTSLTNTFMPLIRYYVGDIVTFEHQNGTCECGNNNIILTPNGGRISDLIHTKTKTFTNVVFDRYFSFYLGNQPNVIKEFQVIQESLEHFRVLLVPGSSFSYGKLNELEYHLRKVLEDEQVEFEFVSHIPNNESGKTPTFLSKINAK